MMPRELSASDATTWSATQELSITIPDESLSFMMFIAVITHEDRQLKIMICLKYRPLVSAKFFGRSNHMCD